VAIEKLGELRVRFTLRAPNVSFLSNHGDCPSPASTRPSTAHSCCATGQASQALNRLPVGTGPYQLQAAT
jgi:ABC-type transport system substrate-binding protein